MKKLFMLLAVGACVMVFAQMKTDYFLKLERIDKEPILISDKYDSFTDRLQYSFSSPLFYRELNNLFATELIYNKRGKLTAYKFPYLDKEYFMEAGKMKLADSVSAISAFKNTPSDTLSLYREVIKQRQLQHAIDIEEDVMKELTRNATRGILICDYSAYEYDPFTGASVTIYNPGKKVIKYVSFNLSGYNRVDDFVESTTLKIIGPIQPDSSGTISFDTAFNSKLVDYFKIKSCNLTFMDGTSKALTITKSDFINSSLYTYLKDFGGW